MPTRPVSTPRSTRTVAAIPTAATIIRPESASTASAVTGGITFTCGGVEIDRNAQVINTLDQPIKGLYASGDIVGLFFHNYPSFTGQTRNAVFGHLAGRAAVEG